MECPNEHSTLHITLDDAARINHVSPRTVKRVRAVLATGNKILIASVESCATSMAACETAGTFREVAAAAYHACAIATDGSTVCWGLNGYGQASPP